jgi:hypothetical protein
VQGLTTSDLFGDDHLFLSEVSVLGLCFDNLNASERAIFEVAARRYQVYGEYYGILLRQAEGSSAVESCLGER